MLLTSFVLISLIACLLFTKIKPALVFIGAVVCLYIFDVVDQNVILNSAVNRSVITLLLLLIASLALERTSLLNWLSKYLFHKTQIGSLVRVGLITAFSSSILNNTAVVATLMGAVLRNNDHAPSKLLIPLSYFAILGGTLTLIGTSTNLVINGLLIEQGLPDLSFFSFLPVGLYILFFCSIVTVLMSFTLPEYELRKSKSSAYFIDAEVLLKSKLIGKTVKENGLRALDGLFLTEIVRGSHLISPVSPDNLIEMGDKLIFSGDVTQIKQLKQLDKVAVFADSNELTTSNLTEVIVSPESVIVGKTLKQIEFRSRFDAAVVAVSRQGESLSGKLGEHKILSGDKLVLAVGDDFKKRQNISRNFFLLSGKVVNQPLSKRQNNFAIFGFISSIILAVLTPFNLIDTLSLYILCCIVTNIFDGTTIRRRFPFDLWVMIVSALIIAFAFTNSGLASLLTSWLFDLLSGHSVYIVFIGLFLTTVLLTETMTNSAAAAIMLPIAIALSQTYQLNMMPFIMAVAYAASASFISPFGYQTNLMVMNAGGYKVKDFIKVGWPITVVYSLVAIITIPLFFPF
ncbi:SLC13 family permease [Shewanella sp. 3_MG-2023]|uniref:SLC13 family permease n=1 Tax=Shewanella sp. 3_MG-2023 TaxID=3062635 RepID=UPI0026E2336F|nr:SLC13 family permease [Shewanella sp. 3_MG-2023]MDO6776606.1 SLC13 family permease [Shewanella sp. 3_MG-2023]